MQGLRSVNEERTHQGKPNLPEEILLMIQAYFIGNGKPSEEESSDLSDHDRKLVDRNFSLTIQSPKFTNKIVTPKHVYLAIPWDVSHKFPERKQRQPGKCCTRPSIFVDKRLEENYGETSENTEAYIVDQDLRITRERVLAINKAIRDLDLRVYNAKEGLTRTTECDVGTTVEDAQFEEKAFVRGLKLWKPRVVALVQTDIWLSEVPEF